MKDNFDLDIKYYALVDFQAFATAIDTLFPDGVTIDAKFSTLEGQPLTEATVGDDLHATETESPTQTIKVGKQQMNGSTLLIMLASVMMTKVITVVPRDNSKC